MEAALAILLLVVLMGLGVPVAWAFAGVLAYLVHIYDANLNTLMLQGFRSLNSVVLLALPLFVLTGYLMQSGGIALRLVNFIEAIVGRRKGGFGASLVLTSGIFGAISGTATAAVASIGTIMIDPLEKRGYPRGYSAALLGIASLLGILIPPSITMILFAVVTRQSVAACFAATIGPAILLSLGLLIFNRVSVGRAFDEQLTGIAQKAERRGAIAKALPALALPAIILGGIYGGIFTPTEAAAVAVIAALIVGAFVYRDLTWARFRSSVISAAETTGSIVLILLFSFMISRILAFERVPQDLTEFVTGFATDPFWALILVNAVLIVAGALMDDVSVTVVIAPLFLPVVTAVGVDPLHFAAIVGCSVVIGANSPPVAPILYMACRVGRISIHHAVGPSLLLIATVALPVMLVTTFWPELSLFFPRLFGFY
ncbi:TRAP transporter large permease [Kaustia mangrovi]|uniref:TRAP transporter large permease protein n=1 Tax=Kaustia mangrovi TaxID=2593653 RepID=A0A7S8C4L2_9HYPH|nr:TRAP transporter large permease [Kaustia mangrovi]QPC43248.1 TRAP transporter large permease [Kaustia mangrovi]